MQDTYKSTVRYLLRNVIQSLTEDETKRFAWADVSYFAKFYNEVHLVCSSQLLDEEKEHVRKLVKKGRLEFVGGGWVQTDEVLSFAFLTTLPSFRLPLHQALASFSLGFRVFSLKLWRLLS